jgi:hypothetical protein
MIERKLPACGRRLVSPGALGVGIAGALPGSDHAPGKLLFDYRRRPVLPGPGRNHSENATLRASYGSANALSINAQTEQQ